MNQTMCGWAGKVLHVDLTKERCKIEPLQISEAIHFIGGRGLNIKKLFEISHPGINPFDAQNKICMAPGLFSGTPLGMSSRLHVTTLSCLTGINGDGSAGGAFSHRLKKAGFDQIVISGKSKKKVYILIDNQKVKICDAAELWGKDVWTMTDILRQRHGRDVSVAGIGRAGENLVRVASTMVDKYASAARGSGGVWGAKRLKAIVVRGTTKVRLYDAKKFISLSSADTKFLVNDDVQRNVTSVYGSLYGITHADDRIPQNPDLSASKQGEKERSVHRELVQKYYSACGYSKNGIPKRDLLQRLGLYFAADAVESRLPVKAWDGPKTD